jgi:hypothetical protein
MRITLAALALVTVFSTAGAQSYVIMPDSSNNRVVAFNPFDGSLVNNNLFAIAGGTTPVHAMQVGNQIWISEQIGDKISRYDLQGNLVGTISGGLDNIRGMGLVGSTVYVTNAGTGNGAPGAAVVMYDTSGNHQGFFSTAGTAPSPFGVMLHQGDLLVSSSSANDDIHRYTLSGTPLGTFHNSTSLNFAEQMTYNQNGDILVAAFSSNAIVGLNPNTGAFIGSFAASGARGVYQLGNGNLLWSNAGGAHIFDFGTMSSTQVYAGGGRYLDLMVVPEPGTMAALGVGLALLARRRRPKA